MGQISVSHDAVLEQVRKLVNGLLDAGPRSPTGRIGSPPLNGDLVVDKLGAEWCFIDCNLIFFKFDFEQLIIIYYLNKRLYGGKSLPGGFRPGALALYN